MPPPAHPVSSVVSDGVLWVKITRPERRNALSSEVIAGLGAAFERQAHDETIRVAVLTGEGDKAFAAGGDLKELDCLREERAVEAFSVRTRQTFDVIRDFPAPVVAAVNGDALGGGAELAMACDMRVMARHASIGFLQGILAITTAWGGGSDVMRLLGASRGLELLMSSRRVGADEALRIGLANAVQTDGQDFAGAVEAFLSSFAHQRPQVARGYKALARAARYGADRSETGALETRHYVSTWLHADHWDAAERAMARLGSSTRRTAQ